MLRLLMVTTAILPCKEQEPQDLINRNGDMSIPFMIDFSFSWQPTVTELSNNY